jgi:hypothetical protein
VYRRAEEMHLREPEGHTLRRYNPKYRKKLTGDELAPRRFVAGFLSREIRTAAATASNRLFPVDGSAYSEFAFGRLAL